MLSGCYPGRSAANVTPRCVRETGLVAENGCRRLVLGSLSKAKKKSCLRPNERLFLEAA